MRPRRVYQSEARLIRLLDRQAGADADKLAFPLGKSHRVFDQVMRHARSRFREPGACLTDGTRVIESVTVRPSLFEQPKLTETRIVQDENFALARKFPKFFCPHGKAFIFAGHQLGCKKCM